MKKTLLYIATSLDGYIAAEDHSISWLETLDNPDQNDYGYSDFLSTVDTLVMGRKTYEVIGSFGIDWPYAQCKTYVVTSNTDLKIYSPDTFLINDDLAAKLQELKYTSGDKNIWLVGGGSLTQYFLENKLLDELILFTAPLLLGKGIPLFKNLHNSVRTELTAHEAYGSGMVKSHYKILYP